MKRLWCLFLVIALGFCFVGCGQAPVEPENEAEIEEDLDDQQAMLEEMESDPEAEE